MPEQFQLALDRNQELDLLIAELLAGKRGPWPLPEGEAKLLARLARCRGAMGACPISRLTEFLDVGAREVKAMVKDLVENFQVPIGASRTEPAGYYLVMSAQEVEDAVRPYKSEIRSLARRIRALEGAESVAELCGQVRLDCCAQGGGETP